MIRAFYETRRPRPSTTRSSIVPAGLLAILLGLAACGRDENRGGPAGPQDAGGVTATERDASLDAIERWLTSGRADNATAIARRLSERLPADPHVGLALGRSLLALGSDAAVDPDLGAPAVERLSLEAVEVLLPIYRAPGASGVDRAAVRRSLGLALEGAGRLDEAIEIYDEASLTDDPISRFHRGLALLRVDRPEEAFDELDRLARERPDDAFILASLAEAALQVDRPDEARAHANRAVSLDPDTWAIRSRRASILRRTGDPRIAIESLASLPEEARLEEVVVQELGACWLDLGRPDAAAAGWGELARARREDPGQSIGPALEAARLHAIARQDEEAEAWLEIAADLVPDDPRVAATRVEIDRIRRERSASDSVPGPPRD